MSDAHGVTLELDPTALIEFKREVFSKYYESWYGHLGVKWRHEEDHVNVIVRLMARLDECPSPAPAAETGYCACAECYENFVYNWCISTLDDICWSRAIYKANLKMPLGQAMKLKPRRKDCKPMEYEVHGDLLVIQVPYPETATDLVLAKRRPAPEDQYLLWMVEKDWLKWCEALWPVHAKWAEGTGWYLSKSSRRQLLNGVWLPCDVSAHSLFMAADHRQHVEYADGNYLRWHGGNLSLMDGTKLNCTDPDVPPSGVCQLDTDVANLDDYRPAKSTRVRNVDEKGHATASELSASWGLDRVTTSAEGDSIVMAARSKEGLNRAARRRAEKAERQLICDLADLSKGAVATDA